MMKNEVGTITVEFEKKKKYLKITLIIYIHSCRIPIQKNGRNILLVSLRGSFSFWTPIVLSPYCCGITNTLSVVGI